MGLPLFVAPVESDLPSKLGDKSASARQPRSVIRRSRRNVDARPFRRRAALLRDNFPTPGPEPIPRHRYPWIESGHPPPPEAYAAPPPRTTPPSDADRSAPSAESTELREALREVRSRGDSREAQLMSLFGERWALENVPQPPRRIPSPPSAEEGRSIWEEISRQYNSAFGEHDRPSMDIITDPVERRRHRAQVVARMSMPAPPVAARFDRSPEHSTSARASGRSLREESRSESQPFRYVRRRFGHLGENPTADGLGDRNRSLSPDEDGVWDTLLTTLTPDPQPPSAGSSFASASASASASQSQSAGASSRTSLTGPEMAEESLEQPCESGVDGSDSEGQEDLHMGRGWPDHWTMNYPSRHRRFVADLDANDPSRISFVRADRPFTDRDAIEMRHRRRLELARHYRNATRDLTPPTGALDRIARDSSEESRGAAADADGDSAPTSHSHTPNDNALHGMQMIMRNLARREDIPDEWWAGAGLSRTLPEES
ncbi:hypothetical protein GCG54_00010989 [Colletotrichum gloeosporioides]|uniref:Uncharacterized protein n=1 Tax=Colletotrichum gloeosporioides TaxID=474922 RepID=A0A8H4CRH4_COLGL|nr:uncharacterized protein GCG54_00010989 [Colletotrichum gloeosporioides]KAF3808798.1 hypothetical protein GCG54_00010989 [Colletotrichum gloeosporioides]